MIDTTLLPKGAILLTTEKQAIVPYNGKPLVVSGMKIYNFGNGSYWLRLSLGEEHIGSYAVINSGSLTIHNSWLINDSLYASASGDNALVVEPWWQEQQ